MPYPTQQRRGRQNPATRPSTGSPPTHQRLGGYRNSIEGPNSHQISDCCLVLTSSTPFGAEINSETGKYTAILDLSLCKFRRKSSQGWWVCGWRWVLLGSPNSFRRASLWNCSQLCPFQVANFPASRRSKIKMTNLNRHNSVNMTTAPMLAVAQPAIVR